MTHVITCYFLQALGVALEDQLHLLLPALMRLVAASGGGTPLEIKRAVLRSMKRLLPRMHLAGFSSAVLQPLMKVCCGRCSMCMCALAAVLRSMCGCCHACTWQASAAQCCSR
jgi:hypothetical protein